MDASTAHNMHYGTWTIMIVLGLCMLLPCLYIAFDCDSIRKKANDKFGPSQPTQQERIEKKFAKGKKNQTFGSVV